MRLHELYQNNQTPINEAPLDWVKDKMSKRAGAKATSTESQALYRKIQQIASQAGIEEPTAQELIQILAKAGQTNAKQVSRAIQSVGGYPGDTARGGNWDVIKQVATKLVQAQSLSPQAPAKIDPAIIDAIKKLSGDQKIALGNILLGKG
jgi:hypothetical protein